MKEREGEETTTFWEEEEDENRRTYIKQLLVDERESFLQFGDMTNQSSPLPIYCVSFNQDNR